MSFLIRKIEKGKWLQNNIIDGEPASADAITICSRTSKNTLSTWLIEKEDELNEALLAIVTAGQHLDTIDIAILDQDTLNKKGLKYEQTPGNTPIEHLIDKHVDIVNLNYLNLGIFAECIIDCFKKNKVHRFTKTDLKNIFRKAITEEKIKVSVIPEKIAQELQ